jgi:hypothetical protein
MEHRWLLLARSYDLSERFTDVMGKNSHPRAAVSLVPEPGRTPRPPCPKCGHRMRLATIEPVTASTDSYMSTYSCQCGHTYEHLI